MARPVTLDPNENLKLIGFQATEEFRLRLKVAAAKRGMSMKEALHAAVELWMHVSENDIIIDDSTDIEALREVTARSRIDDEPHLRARIIESDDEEFDEDDLDDDLDGLRHGDDLIIDEGVDDELDDE